LRATACIPPIRSSIDFFRMKDFGWLALTLKAYAEVIDKVLPPAQ
jgi:hypothetical protein